MERRDAELSHANQDETAVLSLVPVQGRNRAWWVGAQPAERDKGEVQKRFFLRFGADMVTAFTLNDEQTDELIERISRRYTEDLTT